MLSFLNLKFLHLPKSGDKNGVEQKTVGTTSRGLVAECFLRLLKVVAKFRIPWLKSPLHIPIISPLHLHPQYIHMKWLVPKGFLPLSQIEGVSKSHFLTVKKIVLGPASRTRRRGKRPTCGKLKSWKFWRPLEMRWSSKFIAPWQTLTDCGWGYGRGMKRIQYLRFVKTKILFFGDNDQW